MTLAEYIPVGVLAALSLFFLLAPLVFRGVDARGCLFVAGVFAVMAVVFYIGPHLTRWAF
jgi:hypothetical protein